MKNRKMRLAAGVKTLAEVKIQRGIFQEDVLLAWLFVITMMPLNYILRKYNGGYRFSKSQEKINHLMYMDDIKLFAKNGEKNWRLIQTIRISCQDLEEDLPVMKIARMHQYQYSGTTLKNSKERLITARSDSIVNIRTYRKTNSRYRKKNNCMDISRNKQARLLMRRPGHGYERETLRKKLNLF